MNKLFVAAALAVTLAQPASAITFSKLTTIYVGAGVTEFEAGSQTATVFSCSNVSGQSATIRVVVLNKEGAVAGSATLAAVPHGGNRTFGTSDSGSVIEDGFLNTGNVLQGTVNIEATQSAIFCSAIIVDPTLFNANGAALHLVRVNPHPGTVE